MKPSAGMAALMIATLSGAAMAETLVVRSSGPSSRSYPPGRAIPEDKKIVLQANDQVVILDGRGTRTLKGPGTFSPTATSAPAADTRSTFAALVTQRSERRARIGAVRGVNTANSTRSPNIWFVDIERSSNSCVTDPDRVTMWRAESTDPASMTVTSVADGKTATVSWQQGQASQPWPAALPVSSGAQYRLSWPGAMQPTLLKFSILGPDPQGLEAMAAALIKNGCDAQLDLLIETVAIPETAKPAG
jgi:hypothetical protein